MGLKSITEIKKMLPLFQAAFNYMISYPLARAKNIYYFFKDKNYYNDKVDQWTKYYNNKRNPIVYDQELRLNAYCNQLLENKLYEYDKRTINSANKEIIIEIYTAYLRQLEEYVEKINDIQLTLKEVDKQDLRHRMVERISLIRDMYLKYLNGDNFVDMEAFIKTQDALQNAEGVIQPVVSQDQSLEKQYQRDLDLLNKKWEAHTEGLQKQNTKQHQALMSDITKLNANITQLTVENKELNAEVLKKDEQILSAHLKEQDTAKNRNFFKEKVETCSTKISELECNITLLKHQNQILQETNNTLQITLEEKIKQNNSAKLEKLSEEFFQLRLADSTVNINDTSEDNIKSYREILDWAQQSRNHDITKSKSPSLKDLFEEKYSLIEYKKKHNETIQKNNETIAILCEENKRYNQEIDAFLKRYDAEIGVLRAHVNHMNTMSEEEMRVYANNFLPRPLAAKKDLTGQLQKQANPILKSYAPLHVLSAIREDSFSKEGSLAVD